MMKGPMKLRPQGRSLGNSFKKAIATASKPALLRKRNVGMGKIQNQRAAAGIQQRMRAPAGRLSGFTAPGRRPGPRRPMGGVRPAMMPTRKPGMRPKGLGGPR